ncbi:hypothetical protein CPB84DRAFT_1751880 [Gymnopilus junonius]|uniref:Uncharacterized protein n=1 Tax=Gymnopilus junonius TaxID=109634 RepID=A0A9P5NBB3_GYMJU|nr:hypothetical protein CPB84DRAFT_1751880 [Gymnopilus junonius]
MFNPTLTFVSIAFLLQGILGHPFVEVITGLSDRDTKALSPVEAYTEEFIGFHGGNSNDTTVWENQGSISGRGNGTTAILGDAVIGLGIYVTDDPQVALTFAKESSQLNDGSTPKVCAIYAKSCENWRDVVKKVFLPENAGLIGDSTDPAMKAKFDDSRTKYINIVLPDADPSSTVRFALVDQKTKSGQLTLPLSITHQFSAKCFDYDGKTLPSGIPHGFPTFSYNSQRIRSNWKITPENEEAAKKVTS